jgi:hypothetical protein
VERNRKAGQNTPRDVAPIEEEEEEEEEEKEVLDGGELTAASPARFTSAGRAPTIHWRPGGCQTRSGRLGGGGGEKHCWTMLVNEVQSFGPTCSRVTLPAEPHWLSMSVLYLQKMGRTLINVLKGPVDAAPNSEAREYGTKR